MKKLPIYILAILTVTGCASMRFNTGATVQVDLKNLNNHADYLLGDSVKINIIAFDREKIKSLKIDLRFQNERHKIENDSKNEKWNIEWGFKIKETALLGNTSIKITVEDLKGDLFILNERIVIRS